MSYQDDIISAASDLLPWNKLSGKNILVSGATGLIGSTLVEVLMNRQNIDFNVYGLGRNRERFINLFGEKLSSGHLFFVEHDISVPLKGNENYHYIIHAASGANPREYASNPVGVMKANLLGTINLFDYGILHHLEHFLFISSGEVYGEGDGRVFTEDYSGYVDCSTVRACYPSSKRAAETLCVSYADQYGINVNMARLSHVYGPRFTESDNRVYAQFIRNVLNGENIIMKSSGSQFRSWCYSVDCASALLYILLKGENGEAYNVADEKSNITIRELAETIAQIGGKKVVVDLPTAVEKKGFNIVTKSFFSTKKIERLGWSPKNQIEKGLNKTIEELRLKS